MKSCDTCQQQNPDDALFCQQCGMSFSRVHPAPQQNTPPDETDLWRSFIGPNADRYMAKFKKFSSPSGVRFALTWHWPAFIFEPFLWFLYRKMYLYALVYAVGPVLAFYFTQDLSADVVWRIMAGVSANYIYFWHVKEHLGMIQGRSNTGAAGRDQLLREAGGVQPYVVWVGIALLALKVALLIAILRQGLPDRGTAPAKSPLKTCMDTATL